MSSTTQRWAEAFATSPRWWTPTLGGEHRDDTLLEDYARRVGNRTSFKRLGYLLETLEVHAPSLLQACETSVSSGIGLLDPSLPDEGPVVWRWRLRENGRVSSDGVAS